MFPMLYLTETEKDGVYSAGDVLFTSQTNTVDVRFTSDSSFRYSGFGLNIRSIPCTDRENFPETESTEEFGGWNYGCDTQEVHIAAGEVLEDAIVTNTESDGNYPNNACQEWNIIGDENQVYMISFKVCTFLCFISIDNPVVIRSIESVSVYCHLSW